MPSRHKVTKTLRSTKRGFGGPSCPGVLVADFSEHATPSRPGESSTMKNRVSRFVVILAIIHLCLPSISSSQPESLGIFERQDDIGKVNKPGSATYDAEKQEYTIKGSGANSKRAFEQVLYARR